jgi:hypothetical protein
LRFVSATYVLRKQNVLGLCKQLAHATAGFQSRRLSVGVVWLDHDDAQRGVGPP